MDPSLLPDHPPFCGPCAVTIYDQDCLTEHGTTWVSWTANLTPERVLAVLDRARAEVTSHIERQQGRTGDQSGQELGGRA